VTQIALDPDTRTHKWRPVPQLGSQIPEQYRLWINLPGSLTRALKERTDDFSVEVIEQTHLYLSLPLKGFDSRLGAQKFFSRKVLLKSGQTPWVAAHTLVPETSLQHGLNQLTKLENKPLGELLFSTPGVSKDSLEACRTVNGWGRRARYLLKNQPLLVSEYFLPDLIDYEYKRTATLL
jgi:chorismate--pyruvate lyase